MSHVDGAEPTDRELVERSRAGDRAAAELLLRRHHGRVAAMCRRLAGNPHDAADCTQEALIAIVKGLPRFDGRSAFTTWLHRVVTNACIDELRRRTRRPIPLDPLEPTSGHPADGRPPLDAVTDRIDLDRAVAALPMDFRVAVVLRDLCGLDYAEIAAICGVPGGTVRSRIARGRRELARLLGGPGDDPGTEGPSPTSKEVIHDDRRPR